MFPDPCGAQFAAAVANGADARKVVPDNFVVLRGGNSPMPAPGTTFSGATGPTLLSAAAAVPHGQIRVTSAHAIRANGGIVEWSPELSRHGTLNQQHVNIMEAGPTCFSDLWPNPVARKQRVDGNIP
jgi:hypothetical protein